MIYLDADLQKRLIPIFHYALNPGGFLFLGTSEGIGDADALFKVQDRKNKIYQRKERHFDTKRADALAFSQPTPALDSLRQPLSAKAAFPARIPMREMTEHALLQQVVAAAALVESQGDILYLHGRSGMYLEPATGEVGTSNILKMAREGLRQELAVALRKAVETKDIVQVFGLSVKTNSHFTGVNLTVRPITDTATHEPPLYLVILEDAPSSDASSDAPDTSDARVAALKLQLRAKEEYLQSTCEELESSSEELKSSNEEMQSVNEELQSTNEELETAKEEMQSVNEELSTVNSELQNKVTDLSQASNDMNNLIAGSGIGTVFVDHRMRILRFTPAATEIINLILSDVGRPVAHVVSNLVGYDCLVADVQAVLDTLVPKVVDVRTTAGRWFTLRIQPYRTLDNVIEGAVLTFVDITERKEIEKVLGQMHQKLETTLNSITDGLLVLDHDWRYTYFNKTGVDIIGSRREDLIGKCVWDVFPDTKGTRFHECFYKAVETGQSISFEEFYPEPVNKWLECHCYPSPDGLSVYFHDITGRKQMEESLRKANDQLRLAVVVRDARDAITVQDLEGRTIAWNPGAVRLYGWSEAEALAMNVRDRIPQELREGALDTLAKLSHAKIIEPYHTRRLTKSGATVEVSIISTALLDEAGKIYAIATTERAVEEGAA
jgi:two-component system CheB/CheR fusion protein